MPHTRERSIATRPPPTGPVALGTCLRTPGRHLWHPVVVTVDTPAVRAAEAAGIPHRVVVTEIARNPEESAALQAIDLRALIRSIVVRRGEDDYVFVLVPGGRRFDWARLRAHLGVSRLSLPDKDEAQAVTGYERGAITPFGSVRALPVIADVSMMGLESVAIGGGRRGVNLHLAPADLVAATGATVADVTVPGEPAES